MKILLLTLSFLFFNLAEAKPAQNQSYAKGVLAIVKHAKKYKSYKDWMNDPAASESERVFRRTYFGPLSSQPMPKIVPRLNQVLVYGSGNRFLFSLEFDAEGQPFWNGKNLAPKKGERKEQWIKRITSKDTKTASVLWHLFFPEADAKTLSSSEINSMAAEFAYHTTKWVDIKDDGSTQASQNLIDIVDTMNASRMTLLCNRQDQSVFRGQVTSEQGMIVDFNAKDSGKGGVVKNIDYTIRGLSDQERKGSVSYSPNTVDETNALRLANSLSVGDLPAKQDVTHVSAGEAAKYQRANQRLKMCDSGLFDKKVLRECGNIYQQMDKPVEEYRSCLVVAQMSQLSGASNKQRLEKLKGMIELGRIYSENMDLMIFDTPNSRVSSLQEIRGYGRASKEDGVVALNRILNQARMVAGLAETETARGRVKKLSRETEQLSAISTCVAQLMGDQNVLDKDLSDYNGCVNESGEVVSQELAELVKAFKASYVQNQTVGFQKLSKANNSRCQPSEEMIKVGENLDEIKNLKPKSAREFQEASRLNNEMQAIADLGRLCCSNTQCSQVAVRAKMGTGKSSGAKAFD